MIRNCSVFLLSVLLVSCGKRTDYFVDKGEIFHTDYSIKYEYSKPLTQEILSELERFDASLNPFRDGSVIYNINNNVTAVPDSLFLEVFNKSQEISVISDGLFDITCSPLINAWGFGFKNMDNVTEWTIDSLKQFTGFENIKYENGHILKNDPRMQVNTSAIAKGFSVDVIARLLDSKGIENYMCEIGGEIVAKGVNPRGECWRIGIDKPIDEKNPDTNHRELQTILAICNKAVATSGNYRNFYIKDGKKYAHTINPKTGYPSENSILSSTVIANDCMTADAFATVFMLTNLEEAKQIAYSQGLDFLLMYATPEGQIETIASEGLKNYLSK
ncbi:FAD:protein FMN transferase [Dysgonomonas sp. 216]|uniref:FAD:protein FMN transferase n=1 Tax=Dysgonomonas sp. 216 TaxID=2302934 RepID=UPI0013D0C79B|nr:FAD:protein FMN transferase [Dysgonomonas sp. 216]NDW19690.1 FAD:protein FMN transferase [Dysgonomonas sp. 216]